MERTAYALFTRYLGASLQEMIMGVVHRVSAVLPSRPNVLTSPFRHGVEEGPDRNSLAQAVAREVTAVLADLWECAERLEGSPPIPIEINPIVRQAIEIARDSWEKRPRWQKGSIELTFEPSAEPLVAEISMAFVGVLVHTIENAVEAMEERGQIHIRTARENGHVVISIGTPPMYSSHRNRPLGLGLAVVRAFATRHGGGATLSAGEDGGTTLVLRLPEVKVGGTK